MVLPARALPLPPLLRPPLCRSTSARVRARARSRRELWRGYEELRCTVNRMYNGHLAGSGRTGGLSPRQLGDLDPIRRAAAEELLGAVRDLSAHRRDLGPTGEGALSKVLKGEFLGYSTRRSETYEEFVADDIAEPSLPQQVVAMDKHLPGYMVDHYQSEEKVLEGGVVDSAILEDLDKRYCRVMGNQREWKKYLHRPEMQYLWSFVERHEVRSMMQSRR